MMNTMIELALENLRYSTPNLTDNERYVNVKNRPIPSVTEIIHKMVHSDTLMRWSNSIGLKGIVYDKYMEEASSFGTKAHACIERYIKLKEKTDSNIPFRGFMLWYNTLINNGHQVEFLGSEMKITCLWFGGTLDLMVKIDGKVYLVDFKTSNHVSSNYFLQLGGYKYLVERELNIIIDGGVIVLQLNKRVPGFNEYILLMDINEHRIFIEKAQQAFVSLVYAYYQVVGVNNCFNKTFNTQGGYI